MGHSHEKSSFHQEQVGFYQWNSKGTNFREGSKVPGLASMEPSVANHYLYATMASELWDQLKARHTMENGLNKYQFNKSMPTCAQGDDTIVQFYTRLNNLWDEMRTLHTKVPCKCCTCIVIKDEDKQSLHILRRAQ